MGGAAGRSAASVALALLVAAGAVLSLGAPAALASRAAVGGFPSWVTTRHFIPPADAQKASAGFEGTLVFRTTAVHVRPTPRQVAPRLGADYSHPWAAWDGWGYSFDWLAAQDPQGAVPLYRLDATLFPGLEARFFTTDDGDLVPVERGVIRRPVRDRTASFWELVISPGRVWKAPENSRWAGWNKAAFPFSLVQSQESESLLGLAFFYYKGRRVSDLHAQISRDSGGGFIFPDYDFTMKAWAQIHMRHRAGAVPDRQNREVAYAQELADRWPMRPLSDLGDAVSGMGTGVALKNVVTMGIVSGDTVYCTNVRTAFGDHPYREGMRVGVWSASKSLIAGLAALRLARKYGPGFLDTKLVSYFRPSEYRFVSKQAAARWKMVTIRDALQMATGMGPTGPGPNWSAASPNTYQWAYSYTLARQIRHYFHEAPNPKVSGPGQKFCYMDQDMWAAALAMQRFLQQREGPRATLLGMLSAEVFRPIGVHHFAAGTVQTRSGKPGFPLTAWGALPTIDTLAKVGTLVANGGSAPDGTQILDEDLIESLYATSAYQLSFWNIEYTSQTGETFAVPYMYGGGGNLVVCMPNGLVGFALADNRGAEWDAAAIRTMIGAADRIKPL